MRWRFRSRKFTACWNSSPNTESQVRVTWRNTRLAWWNFSKIRRRNCRSWNGYHALCCHSVLDVTIPLLRLQRSGPLRSTWLDRILVRRAEASSLRSDEGGKARTPCAGGWWLAESVATSSAEFQRLQPLQCASMHGRCRSGHWPNHCLYCLW